MTNAAYSAHPALAIAADAALPALAAAAVIFPAMAQHRGRLPRPVLFWTCAFLSLALMYALRYVGHKTTLWTSHGWHFSAHTGFGISVGMTLVVFRRWFLPVVVALLVVYCWAMTVLGYHTPGDVYSTTGVILPLSLLCHLAWLLKCPSARSDPRSIS